MSVTEATNLLFILPSHFALCVLQVTLPYTEARCSLEHVDVLFLLGHSLGQFASVSN